MNFFSLRLFMGLLLDENLSSLFDNLNPVVRHLFTKPEENTLYLTEIQYNSRRFLGKFVDDPLFSGQLDSLESHINSLLFRLFPSELVKKNSLVLFPLCQPE